jgi:hypothetical protein
MKNAPSFHHEIQNNKYWMRLKLHEIQATQDSFYMRFNLHEIRPMWDQGNKIHATWDQPTWDLIYMRFVICEIKLIRFMLHEIYHITWDSSYIRFKHPTRDSSYMRFILHEIQTTWDSYNIV